MYIASKIEDIHHIPLSDFVKRVSHDKFGMYEYVIIYPNYRTAIKQTESDMMEILDFGIMYPTHMTYLAYYFYQCFSLNDDPQL
jgi:cyclin B